MPAPAVVTRSICVQVARNFYTMLVLKKLQAVELDQQGCYQEMYITRGTLFDKAKI